MKQQIAKLNYLHMTPRKVRLIADTVKGLPVNEAEAQLMLRPQRAAQALLKLLRSAVANARHNQKTEAQQMVIKKITVDQGPMLKRFLPRAQGRATPLQKKMSHVTLLLEENAKIVRPRFNIIPPKKEKRDARQVKQEKPKVSALKEAESKKKGVVGFFKRLFRRKAI